MKNLKENLLRLLDLQKIDDELKQLERSREEYPEKMKELEETITKEKEELENKTQKSEELQRKRRQMERDIKAASENLTGRQKRLTTIKTNKEYDAIQHEIESAQKSIEDLETEMLLVMEELDILDSEIEKQKSEYDTINKENTARLKELKSKFKSIQIDVDHLGARRRENIQGMNKQTLNVYDRIRHRKKGPAVVAVSQEKRSCGGCHKVIPPQKIMDIRRHDRLITCEICGAILIWDDRTELL